MIWLWWRHYICYLLYLFLGSWLMTNPYLTFHFYFILTFVYTFWYLTNATYSVSYFLFHMTSLLYLFTGLFKLSRVSFPAAGFRRKLGYGWRVQIGALVRTLLSWFLSGFWRRLWISHLYPILILYFFSIEPFVTFYNICIHLYYLS